MADFYDMVTPPEQRKQRSNVAVIVIGLLLLIVSGFTVFRLAGYKARVRSFQMTLNRSTVYCYNNDCLRAELNGDTVRITGEHAYDIYQTMCVRSLGANVLFVPRREAITLDYGDGALLELWSDQSGRGTFLRFRAADGRVCRFHSKDIRLDDLSKRYLALSKNEPW